MFYGDDKTLGQWDRERERRRQLELRVQDRHGPIANIDKLGTPTLEKLLESPTEAGRA